MKYPVTLSMNHIVRPDSSVTGFLNFSAECGLSAVELRNDLADPRVLKGETADDIKKASDISGVKVLTINALQRFNDPALFKDKKAELVELVKTAVSIDCPMIVLCPVNDPSDMRSDDEKHRDLVTALDTYAPIFENSGLTALIEPLGFPICSVRKKAQAVSAIRETGLGSIYKMTHDTFHHYLSEEADFYPEETGLIHISGVLPGKQKSDITDDDRILVTAEDCMGNREQLRTLLDSGCDAPVSYEAFSPAVQRMGAAELKEGIMQSINLLFG